MSKMRVRGSTNRGQSELVGTVFMIAITITGAVLTIALAGGALQAINDETQDSLTRDAFYEMDNRLSALQSSEVSSETTIRFPEGSRSDLSVNESEGSINITVQTADGYGQLTEENVTHYNRTLGAVVYEGRDGEQLVYQGGGLFEFPSPSHAIIRSNPPLSRAGQFVTFEFTNLRNARGIGQGDEVVARRDVSDSDQLSDEMRTELSPAWTVQDTGYTVPVEINITIESQYALAWAIYADEELSNVGVDPAPDEMGPDDTQVTLSFEQAGAADFLSYPEPIVYTGPAGDAYTGFDPRANASIARTGENSFNISGSDVNANQQQQLAFYNTSEEEWLIHSRVNGANVQPPNNGNQAGWYTVSQMNDALDGSSTSPRWDDTEDPPEIDSYEGDGTGDNYTFSSSYTNTRVCVVAYTSDNIGNDVDGVIEQLETCAANLDNSSRYMPTNLEIELNQDDYDSVVEERRTVEATIENTGAVESTSTHDVGLFVEDEDGNVRLADYETNESIGDIGTGDTETVELNWTAASVNEERIYVRVGVHDIDDANVSVESRNTDLSVDINETETPDEVSPGSETEVHATIRNQGNAPLTDTDVTLVEEDGTPVDVVRIEELESAGDSNDNVTNVTLNWFAPVGDFDEDLEVQALDASDTHTISAVGTPEFDVAINEGITDDVAAVGEPFEVNVSVENVGDGDGAQQVLLIADTETTDDLIVNSTELSVDAGDTETTTLVWDSPVDLESGTNRVVVESPDATDSVAFDTEPNYNITNIDVSEPEIDEGDLDQEVQVTATIENIGDEEGDQTVELDPATSSALDIESATETDVAIDGGNTQDVTFNVDVQEDSLTGELAVSTDDDEATERIVVVRDGPDCDDVTYDTEDGYHIIETVDQLQCIEDEGLDEDYRLANDIDAYGTEHWNGGDGFDPIGEENAGGDDGNAFGGEFDGQGHQIEGLTIDRSDTTFVGLFAITDTFDTGTDDVGTGSTVGNVELVDIYVRGETVVGGLAGGGGGTFINSSVSGHVEAEYDQVGGLVGHGHDADMSNRLVSTATVVGGRPAGSFGEHPWVSSNLGIGGIIGGTGYNTDVSTAYSRADVEGNSAVGGITGWTSDFASTNEQMYWVGGDLQLNDPYDVNGRPVLADSEDDVAPGAIAGRMEVDDDTFTDSVYSSSNEEAIGEQIADADAISVDPEDMTGPQVLPEGRDEEFYEQYPGVTEEDAEGTMANLDWDIWEPVYDIDPETGEIINEGYPIFAWQAEGGFIVESVDAPDDVTEGESAVVEAQISNTQDADGEQRIVLRDPDGNPVNSTELALDGGEQETVELTWETQPGDNTTDTSDPAVTVSTADSGRTDQIAVRTLRGPEFVIDGSSVSSTDVQELDEVTFTATIENDGIEGERTVFLEDEDGTILNSTSLDLGEQETEDIELTWETVYGDADPDPQEITLRTRADSVSYDINVDETNGPDFQIQSLDFPSDQGDNVSSGDPLTVQVEITNQGSRADTQYVSLTPSGSDVLLALEELSLAAGASDQITLTWDPANDPDVTELEVSTRDDSATENVIIRESQRDPTTNPIDTGASIFDFI